MLLINRLRVGKNIFKKVAKIPPGEIQDRATVVKERDETEFVSWR
jgi:hypothetical protein